MTMSKPERDFWRFHHRHPAIYNMFDERAKELIADSYTHYSAYAIMEYVRYHMRVDTYDGTTFKIDSYVIPYYARLWLHFNPQYGNLFKVKLLAAGEPDFRWCDHPHDYPLFVTEPEPEDEDEDEPTGEAPSTVYNVKVYWPQDPTAASHWRFFDRRDLMKWLPGVVSGPAYRVEIERQPA